MLDFFARLFDTTGFPPRWYCGAWTAGQGYLHILSDLGVWSAYLAIPCVLLYFVLRRRDVPFRLVFVLFGLFILACGTTHLLEALIFWWPVYRLAGVIKLLTALVSWGTVLALIRVAPRALAMRTPEELNQEIESRRRVEADLRRTQAELEQRVQERTAELGQMIQGLRQEVEQRLQTEQRLQEERERFRVSLNSIGDGVLVTDVSGQVTFLNPEAERLTGWLREEAEGRPLDEVFRVPFGEATNEWQAMWLAKGLTNHKILVARDGTPRPIEYQAAVHSPTAKGGDGEGKTWGMVHSFRDVSGHLQAEISLRDAYGKLEEKVQLRTAELTEANANLRQEVADRRAAVVALQRSQAMFQGLFQFAPEAVFVAGPDGYIQQANLQAERTFGYLLDELIGQPIEVLLPERFQESHRQHRAHYNNSPRPRAMSEGIDLYGRRKNGVEFPIDMTLAPLETEDGVLTLSTMRDISHRKANEDIIKTRARQQTAVAALGHHAIVATDFAALLNEAVTVVARTLDAPVSDVSELLPGSTGLVLRAGCGWAQDEIGKLVFDGGEGSQADYCLRAGTAVIVADLRTETRFHPSPLLLDRGAVSGLSVVIPQGDRPLGKLGVWTTCPRKFTVEDVVFVQSIAHLLAAVHLRLQAFQALENSRNELERRVQERTAEIEEVNSALKAEIQERTFAEEKLRASERVYRAIGESINYGVWICAPDGRNTYASPSFLKLVGITQEECSEFGWKEYLHPDDADRTVAAWKECVRERGKWDNECLWRGEDGQWHPVLARGVPVLDDQDQVTAWAGINLDISRLKRSQEALQELNSNLEKRVAERTAAAEERAQALQVSEEALRQQTRILHSVLNSMGEGVVVADQTAKFLLFNQAAKEILGLMLLDLPPERWSEAYGVFDTDHETLIPTEKLPLVRAIHGEQVDDQEYLIRNPGLPAPRVVSFTARPLLAEDGTAQGGVVVFRDITERRKEQESLRLQAGVLDCMVEGVVMGDDQGVIQYTNPAFDKMFGYERGELLGQNSMVLNDYPPAENARRVRDLLEGLKTNGNWAGEFRNRKKDGTPFLSECLVSSLNMPGKRFRAVSVQQDVTVKRKAQDQIKAALAEKELLLKEVHHRVKNNLQIISSLLNLQAQYTQDELALTMFRESENRVRSMAQVHERLYRAQDLARVDFSGYLQSLTDHLIQCYRTESASVRLVLEVSDMVRLSIDAAVPCGLLVNELVSNCLKHAFQGKESGVVRIGLRPAEGDNLLLSVADNGVGLSDDLELGNPKTFGLQLVIMLVKQLRGKLRIERSCGTGFHVTFPTPRE